MARGSAIWGLKAKLLATALLAVLLTVGVMYVGVRYRVTLEMSHLENELLDKTVQHVTTSLHGQAEKQEKDLKIVSEQRSAQRRILEEQQSAHQKVLSERQSTQQRMIERLLKDKAESVATLLAKIAIEPILVADTMKLDDIVRSCRADRQIAYLFVADKNGKVLNTLSEATNIPKSELGRHGIKTGDPAASVRSTTGSGAFFHTRKPISEGGAGVGTAYVGVFRALVVKGSLEGAKGAGGELPSPAPAAALQAGSGAGPPAGDAGSSFRLDASLCGDLAKMTNAEVAFFGEKGRLASSSEAFSEGRESARAREALAGASGLRERIAVGGSSYLVAYTPLTAPFRNVVLRVALPTDSTASVNRGIAVMLGLSGGFALAVAVVVSLWTVLRAMRPLTALTEVTRRIAAGDLTCQVQAVRSQDEIGTLAAGVRQLAESLKGILTRVKALSSDLSRAAGTTSGASDRMQRGAESQRSQMDQVSDSSAQMTESLSEVARTASSTLEASEHALRAAEEGKETVHHSVEVMLQVSAAVDQTAKAVEKLGVRSKDIGTILDVIDGIADQINLLSLNAAIEAARAGEHGRGFAVVADEVRKLAENATRATKDIESTLHGIKTETDAAVRVMHNAIEQAGNAMVASKAADSSLRRIVESSKSAVEMITNIAAATEQQSVLIQRISHHIEEVTAVAGDVCTEADDVRLAAASIADIATSLGSELDRFKL